MRRLAPLLVAAIAALAGAFPAAAHAQGISVFGIFGGGNLIDGVVADARLSGSVSVDFHGDAAAGCAATAMCDVSGTATWAPAGRAQLFTFGYREAGVRYETGFLGLEGLGNGAPSTSAHVRRGGAPAALCADASLDEIELVGFDVQRGSGLTVRITGAPDDFIQGDNFHTRCAGPMATDLVGLLPTRSLTQRQLRRGHRTLDFSAERSFAGHGLAGTLRSRVKLRIGSAQHMSARDLQGGAEPPGPTIRRRRLDIEYSVESVSGHVATSIAGLADPDLCGPLDACGLLGTVTTLPRSASGRAFVVADAPIRRSPHDLRQALGLAAGTPPRGVSAYGGGIWQERGNVTSSLMRAGAAACDDTVALTSERSFSLTFTRHGVRADYGERYGGQDPLRTRCPGPTISDAAHDRPLASGTFPLRAFGPRRVTLRLTRGGGFSSDGYSGATRPDLTVVLRRVRVRSHIDREPVFKALRRMMKGRPPL